MMDNQPYQHSDPPDEFQRQEAQKAPAMGILCVLRRFFSSCRIHYGAPFRGLPKMPWAGVAEFGVVAKIGAVGIPFAHPRRSFGAQHGRSVGPHRSVEHLGRRVALGSRQLPFMDLTAYSPTRAPGSSRARASVSIGVEHVHGFLVGTAIRHSRSDHTRD